VVNDGLASQEQNPEVDVDTSRPDVDINEQIFALKLVTNKLENAYNGHSVEWPHYEPKYPNDSGYYGSGEQDAADCFDDEDCFSQGSGSGDRDDDDETDGSGDDDYDTHDSGSQAPAWPPWVTGKTPSVDKDIIIEEEKPAKSPPTFTGGSATLHLAYYKSLLYYTLPVIVIQMGRLVHQ